MTDAPDATCIWLYAVTRDPPDDEVRGVAGEPLRAIREAGLVAYAGDVPTSEFGEPAVRRNLESLDWLAGVARAHDAVVRAAVTRGATIPVRLVTLFTDDTSVRELLRDRASVFESALGRLDGRTEWGVKVYGAKPGQADEQAPESDETLSSPGTSYLLRRRAARTERERRVRAATEYVDRLRARLAAHSVAERLHGLGGAVAREGGGTLLLNGAYLVENKRFAEFNDAVNADSGARDLRVQLTGPWPPYSFAYVPGLSDV
ncbi:GvpL/GvpF family gas vesicle protein [Actinospica sp. MGRD01-02]|uniref:GvpL/GvpF family gas vesicle protein n=1 Tax=Actinospica acidithermotolerans TaxID=2828514 RepID=A0A941EGV4_9ACTN|nr:GvpL/GvpF family gas vesicle protein [Actinospica acidithermotolerans]MBR7830272.1 GvpL/GvpF family gas vesicle protein [Actinospica acidithermotolerans]